MSMAIRRLKQLEKKFRGATPAWKLTTAQRHDLHWACTLQQVVEVVVAEMCLGVKHDRRLIRDMQSEIGARLASVGIRTSPPGASPNGR